MNQVYESQESSSPMITRAVAAGLTRSCFTGYRFPIMQKLALSAIGCLSQAFAQRIIPRAQGSEALDPSSLDQLQTKDLVRERLRDYDSLTQKSPAVVLGVGMGGATTHLSIALNAPFLPQAFVMTLKNGSIDGDVRRYLNLTKDLAKGITDRNPDLMSIQHYDPIHDGWLVRTVNHLRLKLIELPEEYKRFIRTKVVQGGDVVYLEGQANWLRYRLDEKNVFQVGGWGDIPAEEFLTGSERIKDYCLREKLKATDWHLDEYPLEEGPESEWGSEPGLKEALAAFCAQEGYRFFPISFRDPNDFSRLTHSAICEQFNANEIDPAGTIVETFSQYDPDAVQKYGLLPIWLIFNTKDSLRYLRLMQKTFVKGKPVLFSALSTFSLTPDMVAWRDWMDCFEGFEVIQIGARKSHYPADTRALIHWQQDLRQWGNQHIIAEMRPISGQDLDTLAKQIGSHAQTEQPAECRE